MELDDPLFKVILQRVTESLTRAQAFNILSNYLDYVSILAPDH